MGNRIKGKTKKKSIKAPLHSKMGSKRKLSRMGKRQRKNKSGLDATFIGRSAVLKRLQITIKDFRRLCILKGIYPREPLGRFPRNKKGQTFYHIKDIKAISHEPILDKFREFRAFMKKIRRAAGRNEKDEAKRKNALIPTYTLHHLVKERYPRFIDALSDLDDALTLTYLFASLPSEHTISAKVTNKAKHFVASWGAYCSTTCSITKTFISVKGVYMEATIHGTPIRWIVPHSFTQNLPQDVDYKVMKTFFEFYETLLNFVLFKLYNDIGVKYPLSITDVASQVKGSKTAILAANLNALKDALNESSNTGIISDAIKQSIEENKNENNDNSNTNNSKTGKSKKSKELAKTVNEALEKMKDNDEEENENRNSDGDDEDDEDDDKVDIAGPLKAALDSIADEEAKAALPGATGPDAELNEDAIKRKRLFSGLTFFLSREVPRGYLELVCLAYGGKVGWESSSGSGDKNDSPINIKDPSITHHIVDRPKLPSSYDTLPKSREYIQPQWILDCTNFMFLLPISKYTIGSTLPPHLSPWVDNDEEGYKPAYAEEIERLKNGETIEDIEDEKEMKMKIDDEDNDGFREQIDEDDKEESEEEKSDEGEEEEEEEEDGDEEKQEKEADDKKKSDESKSRKRTRSKDKVKDEAHELAKVMMSRKASKLYGRMQHGLKEKQAKIEELNKRREDIEREKGKTELKLKVERLKKERRTVEKKYSDTGGSMSKKGSNKKQKKQKK